MFNRRVLLLAVMLVLACGAFAAPGIINYSGRLDAINGTPVTTPANLVFQFYDSATTGPQLGNGYEFHATVTPNADGLYSIAIGDGDIGTGGPVPDSIFDSPSVWLNVNVNGENLAPRARIATTGFSFRSNQAARALGIQNDACVTADTTGTALENGAALIQDYQKAKTLTPGGQPLSGSNRAVLLVPPGRYDLGTSELTLDTDFVDLVGLSGVREDQWIVGSSNGSGTGVLAQTAQYVQIRNITVEINVSGGTLVNNHSTDPNTPAAYYPNSGLYKTIIRNCAFLNDSHNAFSTRPGVNYSGTYIDCKCNDEGFCGNGAELDGIFKNCVAEDSSFGCYSSHVSGTFTNCEAENQSFGGVNCTVDGTFDHCVVQSGFGGGGCMTTGRFTYCQSKGSYSFGSGVGSVAAGTFLNCIGDTHCFGSNTSATGTFVNCSAGEESFGSFATGTFENCVGGNSSFGYIASGTFINCSAGFTSFGGSGATSTGSFTNCIGMGSSFSGFGGAMGTYTNCSGGEIAFGGGVGGIAGGVFTNCVGGKGAFGSNGGVANGGQFFYCRSGQFGFGSGATKVFYCIRDGVPYP